MRESDRPDVHYGGYTTRSAAASQPTDRPSTTGFHCPEPHSPNVAETLSHTSGKCWSTTVRGATALWGADGALPLVCTEAGVSSRRVLARISRSGACDAAP